VISSSKGPFKEEQGSGEEVADESETNIASISLNHILDCFNTVSIPSLSVFFIFVVTIGLFPSLIQHLESMHSCETDERFVNDMFVPFQFLLFNLFDFCGRLLANMYTPIFTVKNVWIASLSRIVFFPLFLLCNIKDTQLPVLFAHDAFPIMFMILFALSNGYISSTCMMLGPSMVNLQNASLVGSIMIFSLTAGILGGSCVSFLTVYISQGYI
jgi:equilibrative nucleoside transporter 1/2/3